VSEINLVFLCNGNAKERCGNLPRADCQVRVSNVRNVIDRVNRLDG
jgi:hypothetical protein